jgi:hypothetical protein
MIWKVSQYYYDKVIYIHIKKRAESNLSVRYMDS